MSDQDITAFAPSPGYALALPKFPITIFPGPGADTDPAWDAAQRPLGTRWCDWPELISFLIEVSGKTYPGKLSVPLFCSTDMRGRRCRANSTTSGLIVLDVDSGTDMDAVIDRARAKKIECLFYTTFNSTPDDPRYRILGPLPELIDCRDPAPGFSETLWQMVWSSLVSELADLIVFAGHPKRGLDQGKHGAYDMFFLPAAVPGFRIEHIEGEIRSVSEWLDVGLANGVRFHEAIEPKPMDRPNLTRPSGLTIHDFVTDRMRTNFSPEHGKRWGFMTSVGKYAISCGYEPTAQELVDALDQEWPGYLNSKPGRRKKAQADAKTALSVAQREAVPGSRRWFPLSDEELEARASGDSQPERTIQVDYDPEDDLGLFTKPAASAPSKDRSEADIADPIIGRLDLINTSNGFYQWTAEQIWSHIDDGKVLNVISGHLGDEATGRKLNSVLAVIKAKAYRGWPFNQNVNNRVFVQGADLYFRRDDSGWTFDVRQPDPDAYPLTRLGVGYDPARRSEPPERFLAFLRQILVDGDNRPMTDRDHLVRLIQQMFGACLIAKPAVRRGIFLFVWGVSQSGKSTLLDIVQAFLGEDNCSHVDIDHLADRFRQADLVGKLANILWEVPKGQLIPDATIKMMADGVRTQVERKYHDPYSADITAKSIIALNHVIAFRDITLAIEVSFADHPPRPNHSSHRAGSGSGGVDQE